jgi:hypothetical protein
MVKCGVLFEVRTEFLNFSFDSTSYVFGRLVAGIAGSNPAPGIVVCLLCLYVVFCVGRGLCDGLITRPEESYRVIKEPQRRWPRRNLGCRAIVWMEYDDQLLH